MMQGIGSKKASPNEKSDLSRYGEWNKVFPASTQAPPVVHYSSSLINYTSYPVPYFLSCSQGFFQLDLNIYRESMIKSLIKVQNEELYKLIRKVHFNGKYYRVKRFRYGEWEHCWDLAVQVQFFGIMQGLAFEPVKIVSRKDKRIIYRSLIIVNPYELWDKELVKRLWNLQERIEFVMAKIIFHECIHVLISLGKTQPSDLKQTDIFFEFREMLEFANSKKLCPESCGVQSSLQNLAEIALNFPKGSEKNQDLVSELYEFLIHEKYSFKKTDLAFGFSWSNRKISRDYVRIAASKMGRDIKANKKLWKKEIRRLNEDLENLYNRIDKNHYISFQQS